MQLKAVIIDFDGTIVTVDTSDILAEKVGKLRESLEINRRFCQGKVKGLSGLIERINFFSGLSRQDLQQLFGSDDYLREGAVELFDYLKRNKITSIVASGSIVPLLEIYQPKLGFDYIVGSRPKMEGDIIKGIALEDFSDTDFKVTDSKAILDKLQISSDSVVAIGDSPADRTLFEFAAVGIAVNPKYGVEASADYTVRDSLADIIPIIERLTNED